VFRKEGPEKERGTSNKRVTLTKFLKKHSLILKERKQHGEENRKGKGYLHCSGR